MHLYVAINALSAKNMSVDITQLCTIVKNNLTFISSAAQGVALAEGFTKVAVALTWIKIRLTNLNPSMRSSSLLSQGCVRVVRNYLKADKTEKFCK